MIFFSFWFWLYITISALDVINENIFQYIDLEALLESILGYVESSKCNLKYTADIIKLDFDTKNELKYCVSKSGT